MRVCLGLHALTAAPPRPVAALGMFDGIHLGHQRLMHAAARLARASGGTSAAITFDPDPHRVLHPAQAPPPLMPLSLRLALIGRQGINLAWVLRFTESFSQWSSETFVARVLVQQLAPTTVVVGASFRFGHHRQGDVDLLRRLCRAHGIRVVVVPAVKREGQVVSSSRIRALVRAGEVERAARLLGRPHELLGRVVRGAGRGRSLGVPTANVELADQLLPLDGVYAVWCYLNGTWRAGVMNLGSRPTFGPGPRVCEVHIPRYRGDSYGRPVVVAVHRRLRDERRFATSDALVKQIAHDIEAVSKVPKAPTTLALPRLLR